MQKLIFIALLFVTACINTSNKNNNESTKIDSNTSFQKGEILFKTNCANCHRPFENYVGPALQGVSKRWESKELLYDFVRNSQDVISRNAYAKKLFNDYKQSPMLPFPYLKDEEIQAILDYCEAYK
jgi:mono/diheme cytochrome c family protein